MNIKIIVLIAVMVVILMGAAVLWTTFNSIYWQHPELNSMRDMINSDNPTKIAEYSLMGGDGMLNYIFFKGDKDTMFIENSNNTILQQEVFNQSIQISEQPLIRIIWQNKAEAYSKAAPYFCKAQVYDTVPDVFHRQCEVYGVSGNLTLTNCQIMYKNITYTDGYYLSNSTGEYFRCWDDKVKVQPTVDACQYADVCDLLFGFKYNCWKEVIKGLTCQEVQDYPIPV